MFHLLPASGRRPNRPIPGTVLSIAAHAGLITLALRTVAPIPGTVLPLVERPLVLVPDPSPPEALRSPAPGGHTIPAAPAVPQGVLPPTVLPGSLPPPSLSRPPVLSLGSGAPPAATTRGVPGTVAPIDGLWIAATVDIPVERLSGPDPRYPSPLRQAGLDGRLLVEFVVDTTGHVEPASLVFLEAAHTLFTEEVRRVVLATRFRPAQAGGRPVRQLVRLPVRFSLR